MSTTTVDRVNTELTADGSKFNSAFDSAIAKSQEFGGKVIPMVGRAATAATAALTAASVAAAAIYLKSAEAAGKLADTADRIGIATEKLAGYRHGAELSGLSSDKLDQSLVKMSRGIAEAAEGTGKARDYLEKFGLANERFFSQSPDQQFEQLADKINTLHSQQQKAAASAAIFGDRQSALLPVLADGSAGLREMQKDAELLGIALKRVDVAKLDNAGDAAERAGKRMQGLGNTFALQVAPYVEQLAKDFVKATTGANDLNAGIVKLVSTSATGLGLVADAAKLVTLGFKVFELAGARAIELPLKGLAEFDKRMTATKNKLPGVIALEDPEIQAAADKWRITGDKLAYELRQGVEKGLPSKDLAKWMADANAVAQKEAEKTAADRAKKLVPPEIADNSNQKELQKAQDRLQKEMLSRQAANDAIYESTLQMQGRLVDAENARYESDRQRRQQELQEVLEDTKIQGDEKLRLEQEFNDADYLALQQHHVRLAQARKQEARNAKVLADQKAKLAYQSTNEYLGALAALSSGAASHFKAFFRLQQLAAISSTWIATLDAAQKSYAWAATWGGPPAGHIAAGIAYAAGIANVMAITQQQFGGGGGGSTAVAGALPGSSLGNDVPISTPTTGQPADARQAVQFNFYGDFHGNDAEKLFSEFKELVDRDYVFIDANTAQGRALKRA